MNKLYFSFLPAFVFSANVIAQVPTLSPISGPSGQCSFPGPPQAFAVGASNNPTGYQWSSNPSSGVFFSNPNGPNTTISFPYTGMMYSISVVAFNSFGTSQPATKVVSVFETPSVTFSGSMRTCQGSSTVLMASPTVQSASSTLSYTWTPTTGLSSSTHNYVTANPPATTTYTLLMAIGICTNQAQVTVTVDPLPSVIPSSNRDLICKGESAKLTINGNSDPYYINSVYTPSVSFIFPTVTTNYYISATNSFGCTKTVVFNQKVDACVATQKSLDPNKDLMIYPNPSDGDFKIRGNISETALLKNQLGQTVQEIQLVENTDFPIFDLPVGIYYLTTSSSQIKLVVFN